MPETYVHEKGNSWKRLGDEKYSRQRLGTQKMAWLLPFLMTSCNCCNSSYFSSPTKARRVLMSADIDGIYIFDHMHTFYHRPNPGAFAYSDGEQDGSMMPSLSVIRP